MQIEPIRKSILNRCKDAGVTQIILNFSGGSDEGFLEVQLAGLPEWHQSTPAEKATSRELSSMVEDWAWEVYDYSGAGDGSDYGDDITYDLETGKATHSDWHMARHDGDEYGDEFAVEDDEEDDALPEIPETAPPTQQEVLQRLVRWACGSDDYVSPELQEILNDAESLVGGVDS